MHEITKNFLLISVLSLVVGTVLAVLFMAKPANAQTYEGPLYEEVNGVIWNTDSSQWNPNFTGFPGDFSSSCSVSFLRWDGSNWDLSGNTGGMNFCNNLNSFTSNISIPDGFLNQYVALAFCSPLDNSCGISSLADYYLYYQLTASGTPQQTAPPHPIDPFSTSTATRILDLISPSIEIGTVTSSTTVQFSVNYVSNFPVPTTICFTLDDLTFQQNLFPLCHTIGQTGVLNFSTSTLLVDGHQYRWGVVMRGEDNQIIDSKGPFFFTVFTPPYTPFNPGDYGFGTSTPGGISTSTLLGDLTLECDPNDGFFARSVCNLAVLLFVPSEASLSQLDTNVAQLMLKQPFSAFQEFRQGWLTAVQNPTVADSSLTLTFYGAPVDIVSTTTFSLIGAQSSWGLIRGLMAVALWVAFAWFAFIRVSRIF